MTLNLKSNSIIFVILFFVMLLISGKVFAQSVDEVPSEKFGSYTPNLGFRLATADKAVLNMRVYSYVRYLNQKNLDSTYTNTSGTTLIDPRQDVQINKVAIHFYGWLMDPKFRYLFYVWTNNTAQGQGAQVVVAGHLQYVFNKYLTIGGGINSLPGVRTTEGNFPFWLTLDNRLSADEFFRPSYTTGFWAKGSIVEGLQYNMMLGNNLSQLGVDAGQLDDQFNTFSGALVWYPTTKEYGLNNFGDFENHQKIATRVGAHFSRSDEDRLGVPESEAFENVTLRLSDGSVIFKSGIFGQGIRVDNATYKMASFDAGAKYKGFALEGEYYVRRISNLKGAGTEALPFDVLKDNGFQLQASAMVIKQLLQVYTTYSKIYGEYGDPYDIRVGVNWHPWKNHVIRWNFEFIAANNMPVGGLSLPYPVGANGNIFHSSFQVNF